MHFDLNALRAFVLVVEARGVTEAARRAGLPKSSVSRQVRDLETRLGEKLLERSGRGLATTGAGRRLYEQARGAMTALETLRTDMLAAPVAGRVRIAAPTMLARGLLQDVLADFLGRHPAIALELALSDRFSAAESPAADVAFCVGVAPEDALALHPLGFVEARLYAAPALLGELGVPHGVAALSRLPILAQGCAPGGAARWSLTDARGGVQDVTFTPRLITTDPDLLLAAALAGRGVCRIATFLAAPHLRGGALVPVLEAWVAERHAVSLAVLRRPRDAAVRCFAQEAAAALRQRLGGGATRGGCRTDG
jgi:DNA-binding transcriptional LysR family regulator